MLTRLRKAGAICDWVFMALGLLFLVVIIVSSSIQVFTRYVMGSAVTGTEELGRYCFIWMSMLGGSICVGNWLHPSITICTDRLGPAMKRWSDIFFNLLILAVAIVLIVKGCAMVSLTTRQLSSVMRIPMSLVYLGVPTGGAGMGLHAVIRILAAFERRKQEVDS